VRYGCRHAVMPTTTTTTTTTASISLSLSVVVPPRTPAVCTSRVSPTGGWLDSMMDHENRRTRWKKMIEERIRKSIQNLHCVTRR
jgi:hypothetical protein